MVMCGRVRVLAVVLLVSVSCVLDCLAQRNPGEEEEDRRITRSRYKMGYMFGKRSSLDSNTADLIIKTITGKAISVDDLSEALQNDPVFARRVARHLDKNADGYVTVGELL